MAEDLKSPLSRWSQVGADALGLCGSTVAIITGLHSIVAAWLP
jgi:hypothetical protein